MLNIFSNMSKQKARAILLFSGGLDSLLAALMLREQGLQLTGVVFTSNFFDAEKARESAKRIGMDLEVLDIRKEFLEIVKNPRHGHGKHLNPCLDCHGFMIRRVKEKLLDNCQDRCFVATGEVLDQRPFSQNKQALKKVQDLGGCEVLRPLSARLLDPTEMENNNWVDRSKLGSLRGRSRAQQKDLARKYGLSEYPSPAGGCLLTDPGFSSKLKDMMSKWSVYTPEDVELLKKGRVLWANHSDKTWVLIVVARDKEESESLLKLARPGDLIAELKDMTGPVVLARGLEIEGDKTEWNFKSYIPEKWPADILSLAQREEQILQSLAMITGYYKTEAREKEVEVGIRRVTDSDSGPLTV